MSVGGATLAIEPSGSASRAEFRPVEAREGDAARLCGREKRGKDVDDLGTDDAEMVARRIVMRRAVWEQLVGLAEELSQQRKAEVLPADVAVVALEAGLAEVRRGATKPSKSASLARTLVLTRSQATGRGEKGKSGSASRSRSAARTTAAARSQGTARATDRPAGASGSSSRNVRRPGPPLELTTEERAEVAAIVSDVDSARGRQRTIALWLGHAKKKIALEWLRELSITHEAYNVANFAQNMKKDGDLFEEVKGDEGDRLGWRLTKEGTAQAKALLESVLATAGA
jgi:hypothetical protein